MAWEQGKPFGFLVTVSEQICALKKVLVDWAVYLVLPLPEDPFYFKFVNP